MMDKWLYEHDKTNLVMTEVLFAKARLVLLSLLDLSLGQEQ